MKAPRDFRPKVLMVEIGGWGGVWHYTCCLGNALMGENIDLHTVTSRTFKAPFELSFRILPSLNPARGYVFNIIDLYKTIAALRPSVMHIQSWFSARRDWIHLLVSAAARFPIVVTAHNLLPHDREERHALFMSWSYDKIYRSAEAVIVHSEENRHKLLETFHIPERKAFLIKHGNYGFFAEKHRVNSFAAREEYFGENVHRRIFLLFGAMRHYKGIDLSLKAMSHLRRLEDMHLIVAGKPFRNVLEECRRLARDLKLLDHVTFIPRYFDDEELAKLHSASDVCIFPYREIFQSGALFTALAFGKPIIASSVGSFPETLNPKNSWLVEPDSPESLAQALQKALGSSAADLISMGKESLRISKEEHDWSEIARQTKAIYLDLL